MSSKLSYLPTQEELNIIKQQNKQVFVRIEIYKDQPCTNLMSTIEGNLISDSLTIDSESSERRTYSCNLVVDNQFIPKRNRSERDTINYFTINPDSYIWIDRYLKVYYGIKPIRKTHNDYSENNRVKIIGGVFYWLIGTFTFVSPNYTYSATDRTLSISCADYMCEYDGTKNGQLHGTWVIGAPETEAQLQNNMSNQFKINAVASYYTDRKNPDGTRMVKSYMGIKQAILATLIFAGIAPEGSTEFEGDTYSITGYSYNDANTVPHDLEFQVGSTYLNIWNSLAELYSNYEFFFDVNGKFIWREIPTGKDNDVVLTNKYIDQWLISEQHNNSFQGIYNYTEVWGKSIELSLSDRYTDTSNYDNGTYSISLELIAPTYLPNDADPNKVEYWLNDRDQIAFGVTANNTTDTTFIKLQGTLPKDSTVTTTPPPWTFRVIDWYGKDIKPNAILKSKTYTFQYWRTFEYYDADYKNADGTTGKYENIDNVMVLNGSTQAYGAYEEKSADCPYSTINLGYKIPQRLSQDQYSNDALCEQYAKRATYEACAMKDTITLNMLIVPWFDVNEKIAYVSQFDRDRTELLKKDIEDQPQYIIKNISWSTMDGTMSVTAYRFRPSFEWVIENSKKEA